MPGLSKIAISMGRLRIAQSRKGRRPMRVDTFLRKEKDGSLYKEADVLDTLEDVNEEAAQTLGVNPRKLLMKREMGRELARKVMHDIRGLKLASEHKDQIPGGLADNSQPEDFNQQQLQKGTKVEQEHVGNNTSLAEEIAMDHLKEFPDYYTALDKMEAELKKKEAELKPGTNKKNSAGFKLQGRTDVQGLPIAIENRKGSVREGENDDGSKWRTKFKIPYGYIEGTKGKDGDEIDAYVGPDKQSPSAFVVHQHKGDGKGHDEDTVMLGFSSKLKAKKAFLDHYDDPKYFGGIDTVSVAGLKKKLDENPEQKKLKTAEVGPMENKLPWYTTAGLGATGGLAAQHFLPKKFKAVGTVAGTLLGTGLGLEGGTALGRRLDQRKTAGAALAKLANSGGTMQRMNGEGASRGIDTYIMQDFGLGGKPATAKVKPGDAPARDQAPEAQYPTVEHGTSIATLDQAPKVAGIAANEMKFPTREDGPERDPAAVDSRSQAGYQHMRDQPVPGYNPNWRKEAHAMLAMRSELEKLQCVNLEKVAAEALLEKLADPNLSEMEKEAIMRQLRALGRGAKELGGAIMGAPVKLNVGDDVVQVASNKVLPGGYRQAGKFLHQSGELLKGPKGMTPAQSRAIGIPSTAASRIGGEAMSSAGHHMEHAKNLGVALNPLGKPVGGAIEGIARGTGQELQRAAGQAAEVGAGGIRGALGRGLVKHAPRIGTVGEIGVGAGTATALGQAVSPAAHALGEVAKATGVYGPLKAQLGGYLGLNLAKDTAATAAEHGLAAGARGAGALGRGAAAAGRNLIGRVAGAAA